MNPIIKARLRDIGYATVGLRHTLARVKDIGRPYRNILHDLNGGPEFLVYTQAEHDEEVARCLEAIDHAAASITAELDNG